MLSLRGTLVHCQTDVILVQFNRLSHKYHRNTLVYNLGYYFING